MKKQKQETKEERRVREKAEREASQLAFFQRLAPSVPAAFCDHERVAQCSEEKHRLVRLGAAGEGLEVSLARALAMTVAMPEGVLCRCCRYVFVDT